MVQCAIRDLSEDNGSTESSISSYIISHYTKLPPAHSKFLPFYLNKLVYDGEIAKSSDNRYVLTEPQTLNHELVDRRFRVWPRKPQLPLAEPVSVMSDEHKSTLKFKVKKTTQHKNHDGNVVSVESWRHVKEDSQERESKESVGDDEGNGRLTGEELLPLKEKQEDINDIMLDGHNGMLLASQEKGGSKSDGRNEEVVGLQEIFALQEISLKCDEHNGELAVIGSSGKTQNLMALKENDLNAVTGDEHNQELFVPGAESCSKSNSQQGSSNKNAKTKKRRLWYER